MLKVKKREKGAVGIIVIIAIIVILGVFLIGQRNSLVTEEENVNKAWAQVQNQVKRRADLIPNLTNTVKGYASHEQDTFAAITKARAGIDDAKTPKKLAEANDELTSALSKLNFVVEAYPELKANQNFLDLQAQLEGTENRIATERQRYNDAVSNFNRKVRVFPTSLFANMLGFAPKQYFEVSDKDQQVPEVDFGK